MDFVMMIAVHNVIVSLWLCIVQQLFVCTFDNVIIFVKKTQNEYFLLTCSN